jgi:hypothetical protein
MIGGVNRISGPSQWMRLLLGLGVVFALFHWSAIAIGSRISPSHGWQPARWRRS